MKAEFSKPREFRPFKVTIETREEATVLTYALNWAAKALSAGGIPDAELKYQLYQLVDIRKVDLNRVQDQMFDELVRLLELQ